MFVVVDAMADVIAALQLSDRRLSGLIFHIFTVRDCEGRTFSTAKKRFPQVLETSSAACSEQEGHQLQSAAKTQRLERKNLSKQAALTGTTRNELME